MRSVFDRYMLKLYNDVNNMGARVDRVLSDTIEALREMDFVLANKIYEGDYEINNMETQVEQQAVSIIALQQPVATDLRRVTAILKMVTDIERIGDECADICEIMNSNPSFHKWDCPENVLKAIEKARQMFGAAMEAFMQRDVEAAKQVVADDDIVDNLFLEISQDMLDKVVEDRKDSQLAIDYLFIAKYIERIADYATNIAEWAIYEVTGEYYRAGHGEDDTDDDDE